MKIIFDARFAEQESTGVGNCALGLRHHLERLGAHHQWQFLQSRVQFTAHPWSDLWLHGYLPSLLRREQADVYFSPAFYVPQFSGGARIVTMIHDLAVYRYPQSFPLKFTLYFRRIIDHAIRRADHIVVNSAFTRNELLNFFPQLPEDRITVIPLGPALWTEPLNNGHRASLANGRPLFDGPFLLHVGTLEPRKNVLRLVHAFRRWAKRHPDWHLVLVGKSGWYGERIRGVCQSISERVHLLGYVEQEYLLKLYAQTAGLVMPSIYEGFGIPLLEGISAGVPLVASRIEPFVEIGGAELTTFHPEHEEEIEDAFDFLANSYQKSLVGHPLRQQILATYNWENAARRLLTVFESLA